MVKKGEEIVRKTGIIFFPGDAKEVLRKVYEHYRGLRDRDEMLRLLTKKDGEVEVIEEGEETKENGASPEPHELPAAIIITGDGMFSVQRKEVENENGKRKVKHGDLVYFKPIRKDTWARNIELVYENLIETIGIGKK